MKIFLILLFIFPAVVYGGSEKMKISFSLSKDGGGLVYEIDLAVVPSLPVWEVGISDPPLSINSAHSIAEKALQTQDLKPKMKLGTIRLSAATILGKAEVWYYTVTFINDAKHLRDGFVESTIHILMNGEVVEPRKISKEEYDKWFK